MPRCGAPLKRCKSFELRGGTLHKLCQCARRNGLQYDCPRTECMGRPCCLTKPDASCCPSKSSRRFEFVTMGKKTNPVGPHKIRVTEGGRRVNIYDPCCGPCRPRIPCDPCDPYGPCDPCLPCGPCGPCDPCGPCGPNGPCYVRLFFYVMLIFN